MRVSRWQKECFFLNDCHTEVYYINITTSTKGTHSASNFGNSRLIIPIEPRSLDSLFSYSSQRHSVKRQRRSCLNVPMAFHLSKIQRQNLRKASWPPPPLWSLCLSPALLLMLQLPRHSPDSPGLLLCTFLPAITSAGNPFPWGPTRFAPSVHSGFCSNLSFRGFCRPLCIKDHTPPHKTHTFSILLSPSIWAYYLFLPFLPGVHQSKAASCLLLDGCCWHNAWHIPSTQTFMRQMNWGLDESL